MVKTKGPKVTELVNQLNSTVTAATHHGSEKTSLTGTAPASAQSAAASSGPVSYGATTTTVEMAPTDHLGEGDDLLTQTIDQAVAKRRRELRALTVALVFCFVFMIVEVVGGVWAHSLAILTDAAHLLTDVGAYSLSIFALKVSERAMTHKYSYGWHRAEVVGTLISVFTIWALVGAVSLEAFSRIVTMRSCANTPLEKQYLNAEHTSALQTFVSTGKSHGHTVLELPTEDGLCQAVDARMLMLIGSIGLLVNFGCAYILMLGGTHGHSHHGSGGHGHSHGGHDDHEEDHGHSHGGGHAHDDHHDDHADHGHSHGGGGCGGHDDHDDDEVAAGGGAHHRNSGGAGFALNAAMLHALGDSIQSVGVILAGAFMYCMNTYYTPAGSYYNAHSWYNLADPISSLFFAVVTLYITKSLIMDLLEILMEAAPSGINTESVSASLLKIPGVVDIHDLHIWSIAHERTSLSVHLVSDAHVDVLSLAQKVLEEKFNIMHHTIQVDSVSMGSTQCRMALCGK